MQTSLRCGWDMFLPKGFDKYELFTAFYMSDFSVLENPLLLTSKRNKTDFTKF